MANNFEGRREVEHEQLNNENVFIPCIMTVGVYMCRIVHECFSFFPFSIMVHLILNGNTYPFDIIQ